MLQCVAVCCSVAVCCIVAVWCSVESTRSSAIQCKPLQHTATHYNTLQHTATHRNALQHAAAHCHTKSTQTSAVDSSMQCPHCIRQREIDRQTDRNCQQSIRQTIRQRKRQTDECNVEIAFDECNVASRFAARRLAETLIRHPECPVYSLSTWVCTFVYPLVSFLLPGPPRS